MRAIRLGLFTVLLTTVAAHARADRFDIDALSGDRRGVGQTPTDRCPTGLCESHSSFSDLESDTLRSGLEFDTTGHGKPNGHSEKPSLKKESANHRCGQQKSDHGRCSEDWEHRHSNPEPPHHTVPEPGTLLLMGLGMLAGGALHLRRRR